MTDDQTQRPYRSNEAAARPATAAPGTDPLAELARLIGQTDPFGEYGRDNTRRAVAPPPPAAQPPRSAPVATPAPRQAFAQPQPAYPPQSGLYHPEDETSDYPAQPGYEAEGYTQPMPPLGEHEDLYDDVPPPRRRIGVMAIAAVFALVVLGGAGALGYRALFGSSGSSTPPPVIKADTAPSKIVPATAAKTPNKLIYDRVADRGQDEKLVSREERPVDVKDQAPAPVMALAQPDNGPPGGAVPGAIVNEPKKIRTIAIRPDQLASGDNQPVSASASAAPAPARSAPPLAPVRQAASPQQPPQPPQQMASNPPGDAAPPAPRAAPPARTARNAPLSLSPDANNEAAPAPAGTASAPAAPAPARTASVAPSGGGSYVQLSSQRSEADAQAAYRSLQGKYPSQLGSRQVVIRKVELGGKGTYYRAMVGPLAGNEASELCSGLKAAGGACLIQRN